MVTYGINQKLQHNSKAKFGYSERIQAKYLDQQTKIITVSKDGLSTILKEVRTVQLTVWRSTLGPEVQAEIKKQMIEMLQKEMTA